MQTNSRNTLQEELKKREIVPFIGVYDVFSASIAAKYYDGIFISGFGFAASHYGLPDIGFIAWSDIVAFVQRVRTLLPYHYILVDIDDGYVDAEVACHVVSLLESVGADGVIIEDQKRPRRCGHLDGKQLLELDDFLVKLKKVLATRHNLFVVARTDADDVKEIVKRAKAFAEVGADGILADGIKDFEVIKAIKSQVDKPLVFNQIAGGKSPTCSLDQLKKIGVSMVNYSTPCLFAAQAAIDEAMKALRENDGCLEKEGVGVKDCTALLHQNMENRDRGKLIL
ncbi:MAG TPA: carboxyvinyl-carboxyphosphonate phosphorylmutase [Cyanobacteria bacterium UBA11149]|nr:carboxyvinyl-carboxyphosphonate phosphorylmutase [Cyanobacteria bacterium UBA11367]HBE60927.1 carboxyvinyl-carboxyphosphonate phosphorylmutase [Cyanobacteria bacterium UBA11366]HBK62428.1 carboxyvinyl-carboxyphosphonate phosphorylmutase [Cyanobacteria bacterium UBA11166]HBR76389.1 carboxyvinyl-carboxyphosphonate phosphorylmutase [Cyanobacteria bacterium UBA11159]HBS72044.1 carboxyvinyl-carboxyphosphonate phosphorylmutase [Cyanobacteria bacterium UBA11153]HBW92365.1 carboxyvinyl-carboxyphosp